MPRRKSSGGPAVPAPLPVPSPSGKPALPAPPKAPPPTPGGQFAPQTAPTGSAQSVMVIMIILLILVTWQQIFAPLAQISWTKGNTTNIASLPWKGFLGMLLLAFIMVFIATISDDMAGLMLVLAAAMITVYMIERNGGNFSTLINWFSSPTTSTTQVSQQQNNSGQQTVNI